jgi:hypothetical protein
MEPEEARLSLEVVRQAMNLTRQAMARSTTGYFFIIWGAVWFFGFLGSQLLGANAGYFWFALDILGAAASAVVVVRAARRFRSQVGWQMGAFWLLLMAYGGILLWVAWPLSGDRFMLFITVLVALGYALVGLLFSPHLLYAGLGLTILAVLGWRFLPAYLGYWMAFLGGGGITGMGIFILRGGK